MTITTYRRESSLGLTVLEGDFTTMWWGAWQQTGRVSAGAVAERLQHESEKRLTGNGVGG